MTGNEVAGPFTEYEVWREKMEANGREAEEADAREALHGFHDEEDELLDEALDVIEAIQRSYTRTTYEDTYSGAAPREIRVETPEGPRYRRLDKVASEDHLDGRQVRRFVAQDENGGQVLIVLVEKREDHPVGYGALVFEKMTVAFRPHPLASWGPPSEARLAGPRGGHG